MSYQKKDWQGQYENDKDLKGHVYAAYDEILVKFDNQGHRSKVKVARAKNVIFQLLCEGNYVKHYDLWCDATV